MSHSRHPSSRRRPEEKREVEDVFVEKILDLATWSKENSQILVLVGVALVILIAGTVYFRNYRTSVADQAVTQLEQVQASVGFGERETAKTQLYQYLERFEGSVYAHEARLLLGQILLEDGTSEEAVDVLAPAVRVMEQEPIGIQAAFLMAAAYEESGRTEDAERLLIRIADTAELTFQFLEALSGAARLRAASGDFQGAAELYEEGIATMEAGDPERTFWEMRLAEVTARASAQAGGPAGDPGTA